MMKVIYFKLLIAFALAASCGCSSQHASSDPGSSSGRAPQLVVPKLKVVAADRQGLLKANSILVAPVQFQGDARYAKGAQEQFDQALERAAVQELDIDMTPPEKAKALVTAGTGNGGFESRAIAAARSAGRESVLVTNISTVENREGSRIGSDVGAALGFTMTLYQAAPERKPVWSATYYVQDQALSENLLKAGDAGWKSLQEHLAEGFGQALRALRTSREQAFSGR